MTGREDTTSTMARRNRRQEACRVIFTFACHLHPAHPSSKCLVSFDRWPQQSPQQMEADWAPNPLGLLNCSWLNQQSQILILSASSKSHANVNTALECGENILAVLPSYTSLSPPRASTSHARRREGDRERERERR